VKDGEKVQPFCGQASCPDCKARAFVADLKASGCNVESAELAHWPGTPHEVLDNLVSLERKGSF
jgi:hypothetical protein